MPVFVDYSDIFKRLSRIEAKLDEGQDFTGISEQIAALSEQIAAVGSGGGTAGTIDPLLLLQLSGANTGLTQLFGTGAWGG